VIATVFFFYSKPKKAVARNLEWVLGEKATSRRIRKMAREVTYNLAYYWADLMRYTQLPLEEARGLIEEVRGEAHLEAARQAGRGTILMTAHIGNWELGGVLLGDRDLRVSVIYVPDQFEDLEHFRSLFRKGSNVREIPIHPGGFFASLPALRALKDNEIVALQGDRDFDESGIEVDFFGLPAPFPKGPFMLSLLTGAALLPTFIAYTPDKKMEIEFGAPLPVHSTGKRDEDLRRGMAAWARVLEEAVRRWPDQWYSFYDFWPSREEGA